MAKEKVIISESYFTTSVPITYYKIDKSLPDLKITDNFGIDLYCRDYIEIYPRQEWLIPQNIVLKGKKGVIPMLFPRSSFPTGLILQNSVGIIDPSYQGERDEIMARVYNTTENEIIYIYPGDRIVQLVFVPCLVHENIEKVEEHWGSPDRGGFGSTGK